MTRKNTLQLRSLLCCMALLIAYVGFSQQSAAAHAFSKSQAACQIWLDHQSYTVPSGVVNQFIEGWDDVYDFSDFRVTLKEIYIQHAPPVHLDIRDDDILYNGGILASLDVTPGKKVTQDFSYADNLFFYVSTPQTPSGPSAVILVTFKVCGN